MTQKVRVSQYREDTIFIVIEPAKNNDETALIQALIMRYIDLIGKSASVKSKQKGEVSCFVVKSLSPWTGLKKAVEIGLQRALQVPSII